LSQDGIQLIQQMANGDNKAFQAFYEKYSSLAYSIAMKMLRSPTNSDDLLQEVFLQIWRQASRYSKERGNPEAWVITITRSRAIDKLRSLKRVDKGVQKVEDHYKESDPASFSNASEQNITKIVVSGVLKELSEDHRQVLELAYYNGLTQTEIAEKINIPLGTVKTRIRSGLGKLREMLSVQQAEKK